MNYTKDKFSRFLNKKKIKVFISFIEKISSEWNNDELRKSLLNNLHSCLETIESDFPIPLKSIEYIRSNLLTVKSCQDFLYLTKDIWHNYGNDNYEISSSPVTGDGTVNPVREAAIPLILVLDNLRSAFNVGSIIRTAECFNLSKIYFCGYTPLPDNLKVKKTAMGTENKVDWEHYKDIGRLIKKLKISHSILALETANNADIIYQVEIPQPSVLILGNEALGIGSNVLSLADHTLKIPVKGWKNSFNVATACGIACYEIHRQWSINR